MNEDCKVTINKKQYSAVPGECVIDILVRNGFVISSECGGNHRCGKCKIKICGCISPLSDTEQKTLTLNEINTGIRLACCTKINGDTTIEIPDNAEYDIPVSYPEISEIDGEEGIGIAVDIGTTTVSAAFFDLKNGKLLGVQSILNKQRIHGADVISRISFASVSAETLFTLQNEAINTVNELIETSGISSNDIKKVTVAGNTAMELILSGLSVDSLGEYPYEPISKLGITLCGRDVGLVCADASVYMFPCAGGFFGGDAVACMLASGFDKTDKPIMLVDLGTNGEIALTENGKTFIGASSAAGPAFEGGEILFGTGSVAGAICKAERLDSTIKLSTIGKTRPKGICGSGLIDIISVYRKSGLIDKNGTITNDKNELEICNGIKLVQNDIREFQKAKAAIRAGTELLTEKLSEPLYKINLFGGFGSAIDIDNAVYTGLFHTDFQKISNYSGNGALQGASMVLLSERNKKRCENICLNTTIIDLSSNDKFEKKYISSMSL